LLVVAVGVEVLLESLIDPLGLSVSLGMISRGEMEFHTEGSSEAAEEVRNELRAAVRGNMSRYSVLGEDMEDEEAG
jgi:hypothetical protein